MTFCAMSALDHEPYERVGAEGAEVPSLLILASGALRPRAPEDDYVDLVRCEEDLGLLVRSNPWLLSVLRTVREVSLPQWAVTSGALRNLVWDHLHGYRHPIPLSRM